MRPIPLLLVVLALAPAPARGGPVQGHRRVIEHPLTPDTIDWREAWIRFARRQGALGVLIPFSQTGSPDQVPVDRLARVGVLLAVRDLPPLPPGAAAPPEIERRLYHRPFPARGPDQSPLKGQHFLERFVAAGGAAVSTFESGVRFHYVADEACPIGDVLLALAWVVADEERALWSAGGVLHLAALRGGRRQQLAPGLLDGFAPGPLVVEPDRLPATRLLERDARAGGFSLVCDEPIASRTVWAGGRARPGAFSVAVAHTLPSAAVRFGDVLALGAGVPDPPGSALGSAGSPWTRRGWAEPDELLDPGDEPGIPRRVFALLQAARRDQVRAAARWVCRARGR